jgi:hypothetical protein
VKRTVWFGLGVGATLYAQRKLKHATSRYSAERVRDDVVGNARRVVDDMRRTVADGRERYRVEERRLREELDLQPSWR